VVFKKRKKRETLGKLPSIPISSLGEKFSQNLIKDAVNGKKEDKEVLDADEFENLEDEEEQMMQKPLKTFPSQIQSPMTNNTKRADTVFIRIDKFEESLNIFKGSQKKISEIEEILTEVKKVKEKEEREITDWENEIQNIKKQFEKIDRNIFSKIE